MRDIRLLLCINIKISARNFFCSFLLVYPKMKFRLKKYVYKTSIIDRGFSRTRRVCRNVFVWLLRWSVNRSWKILHKLHHLSFVRSCNNELLWNSRLSPTAPFASIQCTRGPPVSNSFVSFFAVAAAVVFDIRTRDQMVGCVCAHNIKNEEIARWLPCLRLHVFAA